MQRTLIQLRTTIGDLTGYEDPFVTTAELTLLINSSIARWRIRAAKHDRSLFLGDDTISVVSGTQSYALPSTCMKVYAVYVDSGSEKVKLGRINWLDRYRYSSVGNHSKQEALVAIRGGKAWFWPEPAWTGDAYVDFFPTFTSLSDDGDTFDGNGVDGWDLWVYGDVGEVLATKAKDPTGSWEKLRMRAEQIMGFVVEQDDQGPQTVTDTYNMTKSWRT